MAIVKSNQVKWGLRDETNINDNTEHGTRADLSSSSTCILDDLWLKMQEALDVAQ